MGHGRGVSGPSAGREPSSRPLAERGLPLRVCRPESALRDENGAVVLIVAFSLVALLGMLVLVVDLGGMVARRREMVRAADAAALAAAQSCAVDSLAGEDPEAQADTLALDNVPALTDTDVAGANIVAISGCQSSGGYVTVSYTSQMGLFFAPVLGVGDSASVSARATAAWGRPGPLPIMINLGASDTSFQSCDVPVPSEGMTCYILFDNDNLNQGNFGYLSLDQWYSVGAPSEVPDVNCNAAGGAQEIADQIVGPYPTIPFDVPAYVCQINGEKHFNWWVNLKSLEGQIRAFPMNDPAQNQDSSGKLWYIVGFQTMKIVQVISANGNDPCGPLEAKPGSHVCVELESASDSDQTLDVIRLVD